MAPVLRSSVLLLAMGAAGLLFGLGVDAHLRRGCAVADTPYLDLCRAAPAAGTAEHAAILRGRIASNPGDAAAYVQLAGSAQTDERAARLRAATALAPTDPNVLRARAILALEQDRLDEAAPSLVQLTEHYDYLTGDPARTLARIIALGRAPALEKYLTPGSRWFPKVLDRMRELKLPMAPAMPLVVRARANGVLTPARFGAYIRSLKDEGNWVDAYGLWLAQHKSRVPVLYNPSFDQVLQPDGFDWEIVPAAAGRAGAIVRTEPFERHGQVLAVAYTGRAMPSAIVRQYLYVAEGRYRLAGQYMTRKLRSEGGLAWVVKCAAGNKAAGRTPSLGDTSGAWTPFEFEFTVPAACGPVASLQLETFEPYEATVGIRGQAFFDAFSLHNVGR